MEQSEYSLALLGPFALCSVGAEPVFDADFLVKPLPPAGNSAGCSRLYARFFNDPLDESNYPIRATATVISMGTRPRLPRRSLKRRSPTILFTYIFCPQVRLLCLQPLHKLNASIVIENTDFDTMGPHPIFSAEKGAILTDNYAWDLEENGGPRAHGTRAKCRHERELLPVPASPGVANANDLCVRRRVARLDPLIMTASNDLSVWTYQCRSYRDTAFGP